MFPLFKTIGPKIHFSLFEHLTLNSLAYHYLSSKIHNNLQIFWLSHWIHTTRFLTNPSHTSFTSHSEHEHPIKNYWHWFYFEHRCNSETHRLLGGNSSTCFGTTFRNFFITRILCVYFSLAFVKNLLFTWHNASTFHLVPHLMHKHELIFFNQRTSLC